MDTDRGDIAGRRDYLPFLALEAATVIAGTGNGVAAIALPWLTLQLTDDPAAAGVVVAAGALPTLFASLASGVIIDRLGRQRTSVGSDIFSAVSAAMIPIFALLGVLTYPLVLSAAGSGAVFDPVGVTAREAMLPDVAKQARLKLERVNGVHEAVWGVAWLIGPGIAGLLIGSVGAEASFWAMFAGFVASAVLVGTACMPTPLAKAKSEQHWLRDALDGYHFVVREPAIRSTTVLSTISFTLAYSIIAVVLPVVFERLDQPERLGLLFVAFSAGGVVGALVYSAVGTTLPRRPVFVGGLIATAAVPAIFALAPAYWAQVVVMALGGFLTGPVNPIVNVVLQERTAEEIRGRALSMVFALAYALFPVGYVAAGFLIKGVGVTWTFALAAIASGLVAVWAMFTPALAGINTPEER
ncbi:MAG TPA: MFS transporter [Coriobacteriia bacterium]|nr:MFS transporter [Coriobacteriia bacterium]